jgi:hypothetical protein
MYQSDRLSFQWAPVLFFLFSVLRFHAPVRMNYIYFIVAFIFLADSAPRMARAEGCLALIGSAISFDWLSNQLRQAQKPASTGSATNGTEAKRTPEHPEKAPK